MSGWEILSLPGDGIGPEVTREAERVLTWAAEAHGVDLTLEHGLVGGAAIDREGVALSDKTLDQAKHMGTVLLGSVGGPKWDEQPFDNRPESGLLKLRGEMELFANLRPAICFPVLADASTLKREVIAGLDLLIVRELIGGVYFGTPRGIETLKDGTRRGVNTQVYTSHEIRRIAALAFELARARRGHVTSVEKANVMESGKLWREEVTALHAHSGSEVQLAHMYADNCAMQLVRDPNQFDVIVTDNLFGDLLSDIAAMLTGSIGLLPSASLGEASESGTRAALYEPVHGSAPDIAGEDKANPCAAILSVAMMLRFSFGAGDVADRIEMAVSQVLEKGIRTVDVADGASHVVGTRAMGDAILAALA
ncbi:MAG: 3-isopropylmalate dehydrogenase [Pseudomonadota bacterium]